MSDIDSIDRRILQALQRDGRISNAKLSEEVNLSASACHRRVQRLEKEGWISGYVALLNPRKMGRPTTVFVEITRRRPDAIQLRASDGAPDDGAACLK